MRTSTLGLLLLLVAPLGAQQPKLRLDLPALAARADQVSDVTLDGDALRLGMAFLAKDGDFGGQDRDLLAHMKGIYVKTFEFDQAPALTEADLAPIRSQLKGGGWSRIVSVRSKRRGRAGENDEIYVCTGADGAIRGMAIIARQARELDLVNIVGPIQPSELNSLGGHLGIPPLEVAPAAKGKH